MHILKRGAVLLALAALAPPPPASAQADELLVMPFACTIVGGRPLLSAAPEQSHRIIGRREQRAFNACSPVNPGMCRTWTVHRFAIDCEGVRVPWVEVVAAAEAERGSQRAWVEDGRLLLRMEPAWNLDPDDPCARQPPWLDRHRMRRYCAERRETDAPAVVEMPAGFAPMLGIDGIFVKAAPGLGAPPPPPVAVAPPAPPGAVAPAPPPKVPRADPSPRPPLPEPSPASRADPPRDTVSKEASAKTVPPLVVPAPSAEPAPPKVVAPLPPPAPTTKEAAAKTPPPPAPPGDSAAKPGAPVIPKIINRPEGAADPPAPASSEGSKAPPGAPVDAKTTAGPPPASKDAAIKDAAVKADRREPPQYKIKTGAEQEPVTVSLLSIVRSPATAIAFGFAALAAALLTVFALARRREHAGTGRRPRDFASVPLEGRPRRGRPAAAPRQAIADARGKLPPNAAASAMNRVPMPGEGALAGAGVPSQLGDRIPRTRSEALQVLGMGVTPSANDAALKKIVDGLRLSWHPDLARDETDRQLRELRLKQINAAWEIIQGKRGEI